jgi:hypothetical protein
LGPQHRPLAYAEVTIRATRGVLPQPGPHEVELVTICNQLNFLLNGVWVKPRIPGETLP